MGNLSGVIKIAVGVVLGLVLFFGLLTCSGIIFTGAVISAADEAAQQAEHRQRVRAEQRRRDQESAAQAARERDLQAVEARARASAAKAARDEQSRNAALSAERRDAVEGELYPGATDAMPVGTFACKDRVLSVRTNDGWRATLMGDGSKARCRVDP